MFSKYSNCTRLLKIKNQAENRLYKLKFVQIGCTNKVGKYFGYFVGIFNNAIIPLALVGYEMIIYSQLKSNAPSWNNC